MPDNIKQDKVNQKVILLYICERVDSISYQDLMQIALESMYMDYFQFTFVLDELLEEKLLAATLRKDESEDFNAQARYSLTSTGKLVLDTLKSNIPLAVAQHINDLIEKTSAQIDKERSIDIDKSLLPDGSFRVDLDLKENDISYFSLGLKVPNKDMADKLITKLKNNVTSLYPQILKLIYSSDTDSSQENT